MTKFREIKKEESFPDIETRTLDLWDADDSFQKSIDQRSADEVFTFYDGPPFATGLPHYGHLLAGTIKDIVPRYWAMKGKRVPRRFGWDCHGLPIESIVQDNLKLSGVAEIKAFGEDKFNEACRGEVLTYTEEWRKTVRRMGRWVDFDNDYKTMDLDFMESVWWVFKQCFDKGLIYQGYRIQPYSPALATPLSNFETNQGYEDRQDPSITLSFPLVSQADGSDLPTKFANSALLVWTTTPWTLPSNMAIAVGEDIEYSLIETHAKERFWVATARIEAYFKSKKGEDNFAVIDTCTGAELASFKYEPLFRFSDAQASPAELQKRYEIYAADFVSTTDGTGAVHIAPSFGEEDFELGAEIGLGLFDPLDAEGRFTAAVPLWEGEGAKDADRGIINHLKEENRVFKQDTLVHSYPHCYRTGVPLLYRALKTWFLGLDVEVSNPQGETKTVKQWMIDSNQQINWVPDHIKNGRFGKWLDNARDWNISRNRFWGTPLPVWLSEDGDMIAVGSIAELKALSGVELTDLHKHFVDEVEIRTSDKKTFDPNGKLYTRTSEVFDCWFESGAMPYAQNHYPFENKELVERGFPADFIAEGLDQTRGWFYTLTVLAAALFQKPAFKNVIVNGIILAEDGTKMSKSKRNYPDPNELIDRTGADAVRLFMIDSAALKAEDLRFSEEGVRQIVKSVMLPLWNAVGFLISNHNADRGKGQLSWQPGDTWSSDNELDRWVMAKLQHLIAQVEREMESYELYNVVPDLVAFVDGLTNWYVRRSRRRFWKSENDGDKNAAYATLYTVLVEFSKVLAPFLPFLSEEVYQILVREVVADAPVSVHHCDFPVYNTAFADEELVINMDKVRNLVEMGRAIRATREIKNRQPLEKITVVAYESTDEEVVKSMRYLILEELNVRNLEFLDDETSLVSLSARPNFVAVKDKGMEYARNMKTIQAKLATLDTSAIQAIQNGEMLDFEFGSIGINEIMVQRQAPEGVAVEADAYFTLAMDLNISPELRRACMARELVNRVQNRRKELDFDIIQRISVEISTESDELKLALEENQGYIKGEVQADSLELVKTTSEKAINSDADGESFAMNIESV